MNKPHYKLSEITRVPNEIVSASNKVPGFLHPQPAEDDFGYIPPGQTILPRVKLLQATSPECADYPGEAKAGEFWHTTMMQSLGSELLGVPLKIRTTYVLWAPKSPGEDRGVLARAVQPPSYPWDPPNTEFRVKFPMNPKTYVWNTKRNVAESGLDKFGSSRPDDPNSHPAATLTFEILWYLPEQDQLIVTLTSRDGVTPTRQLINWIKAKAPKAAHYFQLYRIIGLRKPGPSGESFFGYKFQGEGYITDPELAKQTKAIFDQWKDLVFASATEEEPDGGAHSSPPRDVMSERGARPEPRGQAGVIDDEIPF